MDRVALSGAVIALAGVTLLPFVQFRANRIVTGEFSRVWDSAGWIGWSLLVLALASLAASVVPTEWRGEAVLVTSVASFSAWVFALAASAAALMPPGTSTARVSIASGAWVSLVGIAITWYEGQRSARPRWMPLAAFAVGAASILAGWFVGLSQLSLVYEYRVQSDTFWMLVYNHVVLSIGGTAIAALIGVPLGVMAARTRWVRSTVIPVAGIIQTVPSLALYGLLVVPLALLGLPTLGAVPALIALTLYALLPIVRNTYLGVSGVDASVVDAGTGMGMDRAQLLLRVELPLALPLVLEGVRVALVMTIGVAAVMAIVGAQTLGVLVYEGFGGIAVDLVLLGAVPMVILSVIADQGLRGLDRAFVSPGIRVGNGRG